MSTHHYIDGVKLKALRIDAGLTQERLAHLAGLSIASMPILESPTPKRPSRELTVKALADALGVEREAILIPEQRVEMEGPVASEEDYERWGIDRDELLAVLLKNRLRHEWGRDPSDEEVQAAIERALTPA